MGGLVIASLPMAIYCQCPFIHLGEDRQSRAKFLVYIDNTAVASLELAPRNLKFKVKAISQVLHLQPLLKRNALNRVGPLCVHPFIPTFQHLRHQDHQKHSTQDHPLNQPSWPTFQELKKSVVINKERW